MGAVAIACGYLTLVCDKVPTAFFPNRDKVVHKVFVGHINAFVQHGHYYLVASGGEFVPYLLHVDVGLGCAGIVEAPLGCAVIPGIVPPLEGTGPHRQLRRCHKHARNGLYIQSCFGDRCGVVFRIHFIVTVKTFPACPGFKLLVLGEEALHVAEAQILSQRIRIGLCLSYKRVVQLYHY